MQRRIFPNESLLGSCNFLLVPVTLSLFQMSHSAFFQIWPLGPPFLSISFSFPFSVSWLLSSSSGFSWDHLLPPLFIALTQAHSISLILWHTLWRERVCWGVSVDAAALRWKRERWRMLRLMRAHTHTHIKHTHFFTSFFNTRGQLMCQPLVENIYNLLTRSCKVISLISTGKARKFYITSALLSQPLGSCMSLQEWDLNLRVSVCVWH